MVTADDQDTLDWRTRTLKSSLEGVGFRCADAVTTVNRTGTEADPVSCARVAPSVLDHRVYRDCVYDGAHWYASLVLRRWPREVAPGWLGQALAGDLPVDCAVHIQPQDAQRIARFLKKQQAWQSDENTLRPDAGNTLGRTDAESVRLKLIAHTDKPVKVAVVLTVRADSRAQLKQRVSTLGHEIGLTLGDVREATFEHDRGKEATDPTGVCRVLGAWRTLDCTSVASTGLFQPATIHHVNGADIATTHDGAMLVRLDPFDESLESFGGVVCGKVGAGKSYFVKLWCRRLPDAEVLIVEQRIPAEYDGVPGAITLNLAEIQLSERADHLRRFVSDLWETAKSDPRPRLLVLDELWSLLRDPALASLVEEIARIGRHHYLSLLIATQQVTELLDDRGGKAVLDNAALRIFLKQHDRDLDKLSDAVGLSTQARRFLRGAARGQALLDVGGMIVPVDIQATKAEHQAISTDPREVRRNALAETADTGRVDRGGAVPARANRAGRRARGTSAVVAVER
ncbi:MAG: hypothetical protein NVS4B6_19220 [Mycobacterium sp.]